VIAFDQMGPISLRPMTGAGWAPKRRPERQRATYHRRHGTRYVFGAYDVHHDRLRPRRRGSDNLAFLAQIRAAIPARRPMWREAASAARPSVAAIQLPDPCG
jgi:hypothetical protein